jgi:hypothetical protein
VSECIVIPGVAQQVQEQPNALLPVVVILGEQAKNKDDHLLPAGTPGASVHKIPSRACGRFLLN